MGVEGFIADRNLGLGHLIGVLREVFGFHPLLNKTVELGNSGVFRPEMLLPMGLPEDVTVVAWGIGLERTAARMYSVKGIRELFSHEQDMAETRKKGLTWLKRAEE